MKIVLLLLFFLFVLKADTKELTIKAIVLNKINQFINYSGVEDEFNICSYSNKELFLSFQKLYKDKKYKNHSITVRDIKEIDDVKSCKILYATALDELIVKKIASSNDSGILLVTDEIKYIDHGFMIAFYFQDKKLRFVVNHKAMIDANLKVNYRLLNVASKVVNIVKVTK